MVFPCSSHSMLLEIFPILILSCHSFVLFLSAPFQHNLCLSLSLFLVGVDWLKGWRSWRAFPSWFHVLGLLLFNLWRARNAIGKRTNYSCVLLDFLYLWRSLSWFQLPPFPILIHLPLWFWPLIAVFLKKGLTFGSFSCFFGKSEMWAGSVAKMQPDQRRKVSFFLWIFSKVVIFVSWMMS